MEKPQTRNDLTAAVPKFCLALEEYRRTVEGRVRSTQEFLTQFFPYDDKAPRDEIFRHMPNDVRGPILSGWGIRGLKAALRDNDGKVESVVYDALVAGDIEHLAFEQGLTCEVVIRWVPLPSWWAFWRAGKLSKKSILKALETAYDAGIFDAHWFLETIEARNGKLRGTDVLAEGLTKADLTEWIKRIQQAGDGSSKGIVLALGWEKIVAQTASDVLIAILDAMARNAGLVAGDAPPVVASAEAAKVEEHVTSLTDEGVIVVVDDDPQVTVTPTNSERVPAMPELPQVEYEDGDGDETAVFSMPEKPEKDAPGKGRSR
ncbi:MAG: hypothetical protein ABIP39_00540 [Polyangiaceae bacterium]